jgi:ABC-type molybdate transport system substrate-binding protein
MRLQNAALAFVVQSGAPSISYPAAVIAGTPRRDQALRFLAFLRTDHMARRIFIDHGFTGVEVR